MKLHDFQNQVELDGLFANTAAPIQKTSNEAPYILKATFCLNSAVNV